MVERKAKRKCGRVAMVAEVVAVRSRGRKGKGGRRIHAKAQVYFAAVYVAAWCFCLCGFRCDWVMRKWLDSTQSKQASKIISSTRGELSSRNIFPALLRSLSAH